MIGIELGNYRIVSHLGEGGMATVYLAEHLVLNNKKAAVKILKPEFVHNNNIKKRFLAEAEKLSKLNHRNIIGIYDLVDAGDIVGIVMEYVPGISLKEYLAQNKSLSNEKIEDLFRQMLNAVNHVHEFGYVHRDLKPSNFMLSDDMEIKLLDFGIAKDNLANNNDYTATGTGSQMGTPSYMSPEQVRSSKDVDMRSDIYSMGVILWEMVTGKRPYGGNTLSTFDLYAKIVNEPLSSTKSKWDNDISKATSKNAKDRFQNCNEWLYSLNYEGVISNSRNTWKKILLLFLLGASAICVFILIYFLIWNDKGGGKSNNTEDPTQANVIVNNEIVKLDDIDAASIKYHLNLTNGAYVGELFNVELEYTKDSLIGNKFVFELNCDNCDQWTKTSGDKYAALSNNEGYAQVKIALVDIESGAKKYLGKKSFKVESRLPNNTPINAVKYWLSNISTENGFDVQKKWSKNDYFAGYGTTYRTELLSVSELDNDGKTARVSVRYKSYDSSRSNLMCDQIFYLQNYGTNTGWKWHRISNNQNPIEF